MDGDRTLRLEELFHAALERDSAERRGFLAQACAGDDELAAEVLGLLDAHARGGPLEPARTLDPNLGRRIGRYRLVAPLARGGMGSVYRAERADGEYRQHVAVKLIAPELAFGTLERRAELTQRFVAERQYLAGLDHPHIARLLDGGTTDDGAPYLVMELIEGLPIDRYCDERELTLRQRLELFRVVCGAVQFIHSKLVAHRDLKPSNILVQPPASEGEPPTPKLLDFGIAKLLEVGDAASLATTSADMRRLTPAYASPEQFKNEPVTTASDVYSLGVVLYELLCGRSPYDLERATPLDAARAVCETPPIAPSAVRRELRGEVETIVLEALEKDPARRYQSAQALADDIQRHLDGFPIAARPVGAARRLAKTVARHKLPFALAAALFVSVSALSVWLGVLFKRSRDAGRLAEQRRGIAEDARTKMEAALHEAEAAREHALVKARETDETATFLRSLFTSPDPFERFGPDVTVRQVLDEARPRLDSELTGLPLVRAGLQGSLGWTYSTLGELEVAEELLRADYQTRLALQGESDANTLLAQSNYAMVLVKLGRVYEGRDLLARSLAGLRAALGDDHSVVWSTLSNLAQAANHAGDSEAAVAAYRESLAARRAAGAGDSRDTLEVEHHYATALRELGRFEEAIAVEREALRRRSELYPEDALAIAQSRLGLGQLLESIGRYAESEQELLQAGAAFDQLVGPTHPLTMIARGEHAQTLIRLGRPAQAEPILRELLELWRTQRGDDHIDTIAAVGKLAFALKNQGKHDEALRLNREVVERVADSLGEAHPLFPRALDNLAVALQEAGELDEAAQVRARIAALAGGE